MIDVEEIFGKDETQSGDHYLPCHAKEMNGRFGKRMRNAQLFSCISLLCSFPHPRVPPKGRRNTSILIRGDPISILI